MIEAVSFDFADTLYPHRPRELEIILDAVADYLATHLPPFERSVMRTTFLQIRDRQFKENRAALRENDFHARFAETVAFLNAAAQVEPDPVVLRGAIDAYADAFVQAMSLPSYLPGLIEGLAARYKLCVVSNYPLTSPIVRTLARDGLLPHFQIVVVSADVGFIKPHPAIFNTALAGLHVEPARVVHVGDDWDADILGAARAGMQTVYTRQWRDVPDKHYGAGNIRPLAELDDLRALPDLLATNKNALGG